MYLNEQSPTAAAWQGAGSPTSLSVPTASGVCCRCGSRGDDLTPVHQVVSAHFGGRDHWLHPGGDALCAACTWCYRHPPLRSLPHLLTRRPPAVVALTPPGLRHVLAAPVTTEQVVTIPTRPGRKHLVPTAVWGHVMLDDIAVPWTRVDTVRLSVVEELRALGVTRRDFTDPAPPWHALCHASPTARRRILTGWDQLADWRCRLPWLHVAILATTPSKG